ncbi:MAG: LOG family protein [Limisphaerales bacterium]
MDKPVKAPIDPELFRRIQELIVYKGCGHNQELVADIIENALKLLHDVEDRGDVRVIQTAVRELRYAFKTFAPYHDKKKITVFGSARTKPEEPEFKQAFEFGRKMADAQWMVITGAGPGIMQAGLEGAGVDNSFGAAIRLPHEQTTPSVISGDKKLVNFKYFFTRKVTFIRQADAIALFPGGFGTMDEGFEALTLMQTGKSRLRPLVLINPPGSTFWRTWDKNIHEHLLRHRLINETDTKIYRIFENNDDAIKHIIRFYRNYHSMRWVRDTLVVRLKNTPTPSAIQALNEDFDDIIAGEPIRVIEPLPEEQDEVAALKLPRIAFGFDRRSYGRLRALVDALNTL